VARALDSTLRRRELPTLRRLGEPFPRPIAAGRGPAVGETSGVRPIGFGPDGATLWLVETIQGAGSAVVRRRDPATWRAIGEPIGRDVEGAVLSPDARRLLTKTGTTVRLHDAATGRPIGAALEHSSPVLAMAFVPDGTTLVTGAEDGGLRFWDAATGRPIGPTRSQSRPVAVLRFIDGGARVVSFGDVPTAWDVPRAPADDPARIAAWVRAASRIELDEDGDGTRRLGTDAWRALRAGPGGQGEAAPLSPADWHERSAARFALHGPPSAALWHLDRLLAARPDDAPSLIRRADVRAGLGDPAGAAADESRATALAPDAARAWRAWRAFDRAGRLESEGRAAEALAELEILHQARPDDLDIRARRAGLLILVGRRAEAARAYDGMIAAGARSAALFARRGLLGLDLGDHAGYRATCALYLSSLPPDPPAELANGAAWLSVLGDGADPGRALSLIEAALAGRSPDQNRDAINTLGVALYRAGRFDEAAKRLAESVRLTGNGGGPEDWAFLALAHHRLGDQATARRWLDRLRAWKPAGSPRSFWDDLQSEVVRREAVAVILLDPALPADPFLRD